MGICSVIKDCNFSTKLNLFALIISFAVIFSENLMVLGQRSTQWADGSLRLVGGRGRHEGTVLIYHWSRWGAVCDDYWDIRDATVVCNELGFPGAKEAATGSKFGKGRRRVWLSGLHCRGSERHLTMCYSRGWGRYVRRCRNFRSSAGVVCNKGIPTTTTRRRQETTTTTTTTTTTRTTTTPRPRTARPTTRPTPKPTTPPPPPTTARPTTQAPTTKRPTTTTKRTTTTTTGRPTTTTTMRRPTTTRQPDRTTPSAYGRWIFNRRLWRYFMYFRDGTHVTSRPDPRYYRQQQNEDQDKTTTKKTTTPTTTTTTTTTTTPRPRRHHSNSIYSRNSLNTRDHQPSRSNVIDETLSQLVPDDNIRHSSNHRNHHIPERPYFEGKPGYVGDQPAEDPGAIESKIDIVPETTQTPPTTTTTQEPAPTYDDFRLKGGREYSGYQEGRLEVRLAGSNTWGVVCGDNWDFKAAIVTCRHFATGYARMAQTNDFYGGSDMDKVLATLVCTGKEERLEDCRQEKTEKTPGLISCSRPASVAGVICETRLPDLEPDIQALEYSGYLQDRYLYYLQCAYEENCLASTATDLYGTPSWTYSSRRLFRFSTVAKNIGTADFRPKMDRSQWEWHACHRHYHSMEAFSHYDIIDSHGNQVAEGHKASFCLEDSSCKRGVFPKYNCNNFGHQGISVGCQDSYLADIDCQWIDVTDLKAGTYTFKMELNPSMLVPEISYDNNVVQCSLYFSYQVAQLYNCTMTGLL